MPAAFVRLDDAAADAERQAGPPGAAGAGGDARARSEYEAPQARSKQRWPAIWAELLRLERVGRHDHFFGLGGHSLLAVRLLSSRARQRWAWSVPLGTLFAQPTLARLAAAIEPRGGERRRRCRRSRARRARGRCRCRSRSSGSGSWRSWRRRARRYHMPRGCGCAGGSTWRRCGGAWTRSWRGTRRCARVFVTVDGEPRGRARCRESCGFALREDDLAGEADAAERLEALMRGGGARRRSIWRTAR